jgi:protein involved in ribonucleotide reduction
LLIVYDSFTGNVERFIKKTEMRSIKIYKGLIIDEPFVMVTYTTRMGEIPNKTRDFLFDNYLFLKGIASSGNRNWGTNFAKAADIISEQYKVPIILKFELSGTEQDLNTFKERLRELEIY